MSPTDKCPQCGTPLKNPALGGLCPACLLVQGAADTVTDAKQPPFHPPSIAELAPLFPQLEILELIGKGGMGAVYKARQKELDRIVALKILPPGIGDAPGFAERFTREAKALAKLNHPNIVTLYEFGRVQSGTGETPVPLYFFLMEYVDGVNLRQLLDTGRVSSREALAIVPQICDALQFAHDHGIVHRDIKPENILLDRRGRVKVADFGLAKIVGTDGGAEVTLGQDGPQRVTTNSLTDAGKVMGTPSYMAPEQVSHPADVDHRADIYALGVVFYQMLTGELPGKRIEPPSKKVQIDVRLDEIVLRALETKPELRYQQASVLKTQVETIAGKPTSGDSVTAPTRPETASAPESVNFPRPWPLTIVAALFILSGCFSVWEVVTGLQRDVYNLNLEVLGLPIGVGLLRRRPWWRRTGLAAVWLAFAISLVFGGLALAGQIHFMEHASVKFFGRELTGPARWPAAILAGALGIALFVWIYRVLIRTDVKKLFPGGGFNRPWLEWSALTGAFLLSGGISWLTRDSGFTSATTIVSGVLLLSAVGGWILYRRTAATNAKQPGAGRPLREETASMQNYGRWAFGLFLAGTLGTLLLMTLSPRHELALIFGGLALFLALIFGLMSWRQRLGKFVVLALASMLLAAVVAVLGYMALGVPARREAVQQAQAQKKAAIAELERAEAQIKNANNPRGQSAFGPVIERLVGDIHTHEIPELLNLETGQLLAMRDVFGSQGLSYAANNTNQLALLRSKNISIGGNPNSKEPGIIVWECAVHAIGNSGWNLADQPDEKQPGWGNKSLLDIFKEMPPAAPGGFNTLSGDLPGTWLLKTRTGTLVVLQITGFTESPRGVKVRYKLVQTPVGDSSASPGAGAPSFGSSQEFLVLPGKEDNLDSTYLDLDKGRTTSMRLPIIGGSSWLRTWLENEGMDVRLTTDPRPNEPIKLTYYNMTVAPMTSNAWVTAEPREVIKSLGSPALKTEPPPLLGGPIVRYFFPVQDRTDSYSFRTREGGMGLLQITGFTDNPRGVKIRYKLVQNGDRKN